MAALLLLGSISLPDGTVAAYYTTCGSSGNNYHSYLNKNVAAGITDSKATVTTWRPVHQCTGGPANGASFVLPVNLQGPGMCALQIGWGRAYGDTTDKWRYTPDPSNCNLAVPSGWPTPVNTRSYTFRIERTLCGGGVTQKWQYSLTDNATSTTYTACGTATASTPTSIWAGFEVWKDQDQLGGAGSGNAIKIQNIQHKTNGTWTYLTNPTEYQTNTDRYYWVTTTGQTGLGLHAWISAYTTDH